MYNPDQPVFEEQPESNIEIAYGIEDVPKPLWKAILFALQITLVDFTPFMWAAGFASLAGIDQPDFVPTLLFLHGYMHFSSDNGRKQASYCARFIFCFDVFHG